MLHLTFEGSTFVYVLVYMYVQYFEIYLFLVFHDLMIFHESMIFVNHKLIRCGRTLTNC